MCRLSSTFLGGRRLERQRSQSGSFDSRDTALLVALSRSSAHRGVLLCPFEAAESLSGIQSLRIATTSCCLSSTSSSTSKDADGLPGGGVKSFNATSSAVACSCGAIGDAQTGADDLHTASAIFHLARSRRQVDAIGRYLTVLNGLGPSRDVRMSELAQSGEHLRCWRLVVSPRAGGARCVQPR